MQFQDGLLIILPKDEAKAFFGFRDDAARLSFLQQLLDSDRIHKASCAGEWQAVHDHLAAVAVSAETSFLSQAILGGRPMQQGGTHVIALVRPDIVGFISQQLQEISLDTPEPLADTLRAVAAVYAQATADRAAMVFVAQR